MRALNQTWTRLIDAYLCVLTKLCLCFGSCCCCCCCCCWVGVAQCCTTKGNIASCCCTWYCCCCYCCWCCHCLACCSSIYDACRAWLLRRRWKPQQKQQQQRQHRPCWRSKNRNWTAWLVTTCMLYICLFWRCSIRFDFVLISFEHNASQSQLSVYLHVSVYVWLCVFTISFSVQHPLAFRSIWAWQVARSIWYVYMAWGKLICQ